ncbi:pentatricopeptide repeat-containing protein [Senna tora]|uniref:Serine/threonine-protein phosphatase n=1 Tax=Senna tora TaxID=362788 RepID=A0A834TB64_9FABA|nr:pentatricopeptide repeat-containing protein [Senna tora]
MASPGGYEGETRIQLLYTLRDDLLAAENAPNQFETDSSILTYERASPISSPKWNQSDVTASIEGLDSLSPGGKALGIDKNTMEKLTEASAAEAEAASAVWQAMQAVSNNPTEEMSVSDGSSQAAGTASDDNNTEGDVRLHPRAVVVAKEATGNLGGMVRQLSLDQFENESRRMVPIISTLLIPRNWKAPTNRRFFLDSYEVGELCYAAEQIFMHEPTVLQLKAPVKVFGDLHGQFGDLMRLFDEYGFPSTEGDITCSESLYLKSRLIEIEYPDNVHLIRGNHEAADINALFGFRIECIERMGENDGIWAWTRFNQLFNYLPLAALIEKKIICMHGGIGRSIHSVEQIEKLQRPISMEAGSIVLMDLLWSDPTENDSVEGLRPNARGPGLVTFGPDRVTEFCKKNKLQLILRAHECVMDGFERFAQGQLITLFSATNYCGTANNAGAILVVGRGLVVVPKLIHPLPPPFLSPETSPDRANEETWMQELNVQRPPTPTRGRPQPDHDQNQRKAFANAQVLFIYIYIYMHAIHMKLLVLTLKSLYYPSCLFLRSCKLFSSVSSTSQFKWNSTTNVIITNPILVIMESCSTMRQLKQIQARMTCTGLVTHTFPISRVLAFCALADGGDLRYAHLLFSQIEKPNTYMWNTMIRGYCKAKIPTVAFLFFCQMVGEQVEMDCRSFVFALKVCEQFERDFQGDSVHCRIRKTGFDSELLVRNGLIHFYADRGCVRLARELFDESSLRDVVTWTSMIDGYATRNYSDEAMNLFKLMLSSDIEPNEVTFIALLSACSRKGDLSVGKSIHECIKKNINCSLSLHNALLDMYVKCSCLKAARELFDRMENRDVFSWTSLVNGYAKCGDLESARRFFDLTPEKNVVSWNALIAGYSQNNKPKEALQLFHEMIGAGMIPVEPTLVSVLSACGQMSCLNLGQWIHEYFINRRRIHLSVTLANAFIDMYAKCGSIDTAEEVFNAMSETERDLVSWNSMIAGYASNGRAKQAINLFDQMMHKGFKPDDITFVSLLTACSHGGLVSKGQQYFDSMERNYGIEPKREHYACMIDLFGRNGLLEEAYKLITNMPMKPCEAAWGALLNACKMHGNVELAKLSACNLLRLDAKDSGIYVLLANICANERNWGDVKMVRSLMREKGVKKLPGRSLVEIEGEFIEFLVADESHPQSEEIYKILNQIYFLSDPEDHICECESENEPSSMNLQYWDDCS